MYPLFLPCLMFLSPMSLSSKPGDSQLQQDEAGEPQKQTQHKANRKGKKEKSKKRRDGSSKGRKGKKESRKKRKESSGPDELSNGLSTAVPDLLLATVLPSTDLSPLATLTLPKTTPPTAPATEAASLSPGFLPETSEIPEMPTHEPDSSVESPAVVPTELPEPLSPRVEVE